MKNKTTYIHETHTLFANDGELHLLYDSGDYDKELIFNVESLYTDLPTIIRLCVEQKKQMDENTLERLKSTLKEL